MKNKKYPFIAVYNVFIHKDNANDPVIKEVIQKIKDGRKNYFPKLGVYFDAGK